MNKIRLNQFLSQAGICSRRRADVLILSGKIFLNGKIVSVLGEKIDPEKDRVFCDGKEVLPRKQWHYILFHKPAGYVSTRRKFKGEKNVYELLPKQWQHLWSIGRLDKNSEGLLVFTNDGELTLKLSHPKFLHEKIYEVLLDVKLFPIEMEKIRKGMDLEEGKTAPAKIKHLHENWYEITLREGKKRQIRRMMEVLGKNVIRLKRTQFGPFYLDDLQEGAWKEVEYLS